MAARTWVIRPLTLPVGESVYEVAPVGYDTGLELQTVLAGEHDTITKDSPDADWFRLCMGETWDLMKKDGQPYPVMFRAGVASIQFQVALVNGIDMDAAVAIGEQAWDSDLDPEALAAALTAASQTQGTSTPSTSTASAGKTPPRASTKPMTSRRRTPPAKSSPKRATTRSAKSPSGKSPAHGSG